MHFLKILGHQVPGPIHDYGLFYLSALQSIKK